MPTVHLLTAYFPFGRREQFLESEMAVWEDFDGANLILIPSRVADNARSLPQNARLDTSVPSKEGLVAKVASSLKALTAPLFFREISWLKANKRLTITSAGIALVKVASVLLRYQALRDVFAHREPPVICYSYWFDTSAYAAALLKRDGLINTLITRAHRFDVYEELQPNKYMPLKRQFAHDFDSIHAVSRQTKSYLQNQYAIPQNRITVSRLGVDIPQSETGTTSGNILYVLSISRCSRMKRLDRVIRAIAAASHRIDKDKSFRWTHIGDGELMGKLKREARLTLGPRDNVEYEFLGHLTNENVLNYIGSNRIDVLINTSESEGVPVTFMEAMSRGIPVVAPDVGGIREIITEENGWLLSARPSIQEIANILCNFTQFKESQVRSNARQKIIEEYDAAKNYPEFINSIVNRSTPKGL